MTRNKHPFDMDANEMDVYIQQLEHAAVKNVKYIGKYEDNCTCGECGVNYGSSSDTQECLPLFL